MERDSLEEGAADANLSDSSCRVRGTGKQWEEEENCHVDVEHFSTFIKGMICYASGMKGMLSCWKCRIEWFGANLAHD